MKKKKKTSERVVSPHDGVVKKYLGKLETSRSLFEENLPEKIKKDLDFD